MNNSRCVCSRKSRRDLLRDAQRFIQRQRSITRYPVPQSFSGI
jgi:hypothetical protein